MISPKTGVCSDCDNECELFYNGRYHKICRKCYASDKNIELRRRQKENSKRYRERHPERSRISVRKSAVISKGLGVDEVFDYIENHDGLCDICGGPPTRGHLNLSIDHSHISGKFRGLLCSEHNVALGLFKDDIGVLAKAIEYLSERGD